MLAPHAQIGKAIAVHKQMTLADLRKKAKTALVVSLDGCRAFGQAARLKGKDTVGDVEGPDIESMYDTPRRLRDLGSQDTFYFSEDPFEDGEDERKQSEGTTSGEAGQSDDREVRSATTFYPTMVEGGTGDDNTPEEWEDDWRGSAGHGGEDSGSSMDEEETWQTVPCGRWRRRGNPRGQTPGSGAREPGPLRPRSGRLWSDEDDEEPEGPEGSTGGAGGCTYYAPWNGQWSGRERRDPRR